MNQVNTKPSILVIMAAYNGEKYVAEQISSILNQKDVDVELAIYDDGSRDRTREVVNSFIKDYNNISYIVNEKNKGFAYNFFDALFQTKKKYDYYAFSDQDDYWENNKLINAVKTIENINSEKGCLYCSNLKIGDEKLNVYDIQEKRDLSKYKKYTVLSSNFATGCTIVFDYKLFERIIKHYPSKNIQLHDYWILLIAAFTANYCYDFNSYIIYRQHSNNQIGASKRIIKKGNNKKYSTSSIIANFLESYKDDIDDRDKKLLNKISNYKRSLKDKIYLLFSRKIVSRKNKLKFKIKILLNKY